MVNSIYSTHNSDREHLLIAKDTAYLGEVKSYKNSWRITKFFAKLFGSAIDIQINGKIKTVDRGDYIRFLSNNTNVTIDKKNVYAFSDVNALTLNVPQTVEFMRDHVDAGKQRRLGQKFFAAVFELHDAEKALKYAGKGALTNSYIVKWEGWLRLTQFKSGKELPKKVMHQEKWEKDLKPGESREVQFVVQNAAYFIAEAANGKRAVKDLAFQNGQADHVREMAQMDQNLYATRQVTRQLEELGDEMSKINNPNYRAPKRKKIEKPKLPEIYPCYEPSQEKIDSEAPKMQQLSEFLAKLGDIPSAEKRTKTIKSSQEAPSKTITSSKNISAQTASSNAPQANNMVLSALELLYKNQQEITKNKLEIWQADLQNDKAANDVLNSAQEEIRLLRMIESAKAQLVSH